MRIAFISDSHGLHKNLELPDGDMIVFAGDMSGRGTLDEIQPFLNWFSELNYEYKIITSGNHDFLFEKEPVLAKSIIPENIIYLEDSGIEISGLKIWGSPITPWFHNWAFNKQRGSEIKKHWDRIPDDIDILITHGPPYGILDKTVSGKNVGCIDLLNRVNELKPKIHVFGHIHEDYGVVKQNETTFINASVLNYKYEISNDPILIDV